MPDDRVHSLTIFLAREGEPPLVTPSAGLQTYHIKINDNTEGDLFIQPPSPKPPEWGQFFQGYIDPSEFGKNSSTSAALIVNTRQRQFAITFGKGRFLLNDDSLEDRFGLKVALNCIGEDTIRSIDKHSLDQLLRHSREQASRDATAGEFGFDVEQDLLRAVVGKPTESKTFGPRIAGAQSLHLSLPVHLSGLPELLDTVCDKFLENTYKQRFPWLDQISEVSSLPVRRTLDELLVEKIRAGETQQIWMAVPELITWNAVRGFQFKARRSTPERHDIHLHDFIYAVGGPDSVTRESMQKRVVALDPDGKTKYVWSAYRCTYAEVELDGESFLLSGGNWYSVKQDFVNQTNLAFNRIATYERGFLRIRRCLRRRLSQTSLRNGSPKVCADGSTQHCLRWQSQ